THCRSSISVLHVTFSRAGPDLFSLREQRRGQTRRRSRKKRDKKIPAQSHRQGRVIKQGMAINMLYSKD
ncbi:hypothetical protein, partial [Aeromonas caviae]|uniref:hypothetical protein n=1 Tax=Aeromonas caviae TaxID=648 RepID=UPI00403F7DD8